MARSNRNSGKGGGLLDSGVAALAALSGGFVTYAMPEGLFSRIIVATHLPQFLAAAQPPLGMKARMAVIAAVVLVIYAFVWTLMRALDSLGGRRRPAEAAPFVPEEEAPRLRRADSHPDAPSRRPIFAGRDLGEPEFDEGEFEEGEFEEAPLELAPETAIASEPEPEFESEFEPAAEPEFEPESAEAPEPESDPLPAFLVPQQHEPEIEPEPEPVEEPAPPAFAAQRFDVPVDEFGEAAEAEDEAEEEPEASESDDDQSLARLMQRFESGLGRKQQALDAAPPAPVAAIEPEPEPQPIPQERVGHRLRSAISELNKMSGSGR